MCRVHKVLKHLCQCVCVRVTRASTATGDIECNSTTKEACLLDSSIHFVKKSGRRGDERAAQESRHAGDESRKGGMVPAPVSQITCRAHSRCPKCQAEQSAGKVS